MLSAASNRNAIELGGEEPAAQDLIGCSPGENGTGAEKAGGGQGDALQARLGVEPSESRAHLLRTGGTAPRWTAF